MTLAVALANEKGGVAKTTTALSLGAALAEGQRRVLLVDLDPQANLTVSLGIQPTELSRSITDVLLGNYPPARLSQPTAVARMDLIPANHELYMAEQFLGVRESYEHLLRHALQTLSGYDLVLLDCPPSLGPITRCALTAAQLLVIPTQCEFYSAYALREMLELIRSIRMRTNPRLRYRVLLTMLDRRNRVHRELEQQIRSAFGAAAFQTVIEVDTRLREAPVLKQPVTVYAPASRAAEQYRALAQELRQHHGEEAVGSTQPSA